MKRVRERKVWSLRVWSLNYHNKSVMPKYQSVMPKIDKSGKICIAYSVENMKVNVKTFIKKTKAVKIGSL